MSHQYTLYFGENDPDEIVVTGEGEVIKWSVYSKFSYDHVLQSPAEIQRVLSDDFYQRRIQEELIYQKEQLALRAAELQGEDDRGN